MPRHRLLTEDELRQLFGVPADRDALARQFTLTPSDHDLVLTRRGDTNRLGFAVQLALLRQSGRALAQVEEPIDPLIAWIAAQIDVPAHLFADYARRHQTMTDHVRQLASMLGLRPSTDADLPLMIEAAAQAAWTAHKPGVIVTAIVAALRSEKLILPALAVIERTGAAGRARARKRAADALVAGLTDEQLAKLDRLPVVDPELGGTPLAWLKTMPSAPKAGHVRDLLGKLQVVRAVGIPSDLASRLPEIRFRQFVREGQASPAYLLGRYTAHRRRATLVAVLFDLESRLTDAVLDMADRLIGGAFTRGKHAKEKSYAATTRDVGRLMRLFHDTIEALGAAQDSDRDAFAVVDETVGWAKLLRARPEVASLANLAEENPLIRAADRYITIRKFVPALLEALTFKAARDNDPLLAAVTLLRELNRSGKREVPSDAPMPFRKEWRRLVVESGKSDRRLYEMAVLATLRNKLRSGDVWVERSSSYRRFDSYLLPTAAVPPVVSELGLADTADAWLAARSQELDERLKRFAQRLRRNQLDGVELRDERLHITPLKAATPAEATALAARLDALLPRVRITELLHEVNRATGFAAAFTNLRTGESCANENALLAAILADGTNLGLARMADASQGITRDQLVWTADAYIRPETYQAALVRIIDAQHRLPIATVWGGGTTSSSDGQFFRSGKRGNVAGEVNARYGVDPGFSFYTHVSDQHGPFHVQVISAATHEAPYVLDGLLHHGTSLKIDTHYVDTGGVSVMWTSQAVPAHADVGVRSINPFVRSCGPSLRPDLPPLMRRGRVAVKDGRRPPRSGAPASLRATRPSVPQWLQARNASHRGA